MRIDYQICGSGRNWKCSSQFLIYTFVRTSDEIYSIRCIYDKRAHQDAIEFLEFVVDRVVGFRPRPGRSYGNFGSEEGFIVDTDWICRSQDLTNASNKLSGFLDCKRGIDV